MERKVNNIYRRESLILGLEMPCDCGCKQVNEPTLVDLQFANREHRWAEMRKLERDFFAALIDTVTWYEQEALEIFGLPKIDVVRESFLRDIDSRGTVSITSDQAARYREMLSRWQLELIGDKKLMAKQNEDEDEAIYQYYMLTAFAIGLKRHKRTILRNAPAELAAYLERMDIVPDIDNLYLQGVIKKGLTRVKTKLALDYRDEVLTGLRRMAREGLNPLEIGRFL